MEGQVPVIVATVSFGMGVDKGNVRLATISHAGWLVGLSSLPMINPRPVSGSPRATSGRTTHTNIIAQLMN